ncbi:MAG: hypothetical protein ABW092_17770 [Candidatus Thiodiazotropha sp.]
MSQLNSANATLRWCGNLTIVMMIGFSLFLNTAHIQAQPVHVQVDGAGGIEYGAGISVGKGEECFIITPSHVIEGAGKNAITVTNLKGKRAKARVLKQVMDFDAALLKLQDSSNFDCPEDWDTGTGLGKKIENAPFLISKKVNDNGRVEQNRLFVSGLSAETIELEPYNERSKLQEGDSGSSVYAASHLVGMVISVDTATGEVIAVSQSQLHGLFGKDVLLQNTQIAMLVPFIYNRAENVYATSAAFEYLEQKTPFRLQESQPRTRQQISKGETPTAPEGVDYVISGKILDLTSKRVKNPDYKPEKKQTNQKDKKQSFKDMFVASLKKSLTNKNQSYRYFRKYNIDIEVQVQDASSNKYARNLERVAYQVPEDGTHVNELNKVMIRNAVIYGLDRTFKKYGLPTK